MDRPGGDTWARRKPESLAASEEMRIPPEQCERSDSADAERPALSESGRTGLLAASEQQVLTKLKLEGLSAKQLAQLDGSTSEEAVHHRSQRIMAGLRKVASRLRSHAHR